MKKVAPEPMTQPKVGSPLRQSFEVHGEKTENDKHTAANGDKSGTKEEKLDDIELDSESEEEEDVVIHEVHQAAAPQVINRARIVQVAKPVAPMLPPRNPNRNSRNRNSATSDASTERGAEEKPSPLSTPSLRHGDSTSSLSSVEGEHAAQTGAHLQPQQDKQEEEKKEDDKKSEVVASRPDSPVKAVPGAF